MRSKGLRVLSIAVPALVAGVFLLPAGPAAAATDDIRATPHHLVLTPGGPPGRTTITWSTTTPVAEVWASVNGGRRQIIARTGRTGRYTRQIDWIRPGYTVFALHRGRTDQPQNHVPSGPLLDYTSVTTQPPPANTLGFAYWPINEGSASTLGRRWPALVPAVSKDLDLIASMGGGVVRLVLWPIAHRWSGDPAVWKITGGPGGDEVRQELLATQAANLVELIKLCRDRGLRVTVTFANTYLRRGGRASDRQFEWEWAYPPEDGGWDGFLRDSLLWVNGYVKRIESNPDPSVRSTVIAYDYQNEVGARLFPYVNQIYDRSAIPRGKRGVSLLSVAADVSALKDALGSRHLDYIEYHSYPGGSNPQTTAAYHTLARAFPDSTVILGEFGQITPGTCDRPSIDEASQAQTVTNKILQARSVGISYFLHWMLWDSSPPYRDQLLGLGYGPDCPKDALGSMITLTSRLSNPDMERIVSGKPQDWRANGRGPGEGYQIELKSQGSAEDAAATNGKYARLIVRTPPGRAWISSRSIAVRGGDALWVNAYVRSNMKDVGLGVTQIRSDDRVVRTPGPSFTPTEFAWKSWLHHVGSWKVCLHPLTTKVIVGVRGNANSTQGSPVAARYYLDVDAVSAATRPRPPSCG
jgi:hypothetical protein